MALKIDKEFHNIKVPGAYCVVGSLGFSQNKMEVLFTLYSRATQESEPFASQSFASPYELTGPDPFKQAYQYLKKLPEFAYATDC